MVEQAVHLGRQIRALPFLMDRWTHWIWTPLCWIAGHTVIQSGTISNIEGCSVCGSMWRTDEK